MDPPTFIIIIIVVTAGEQKKKNQKTYLHRWVWEALHILTPRGTDSMPAARTAQDSATPGALQGKAEPITHPPSQVEWQGENIVPAISYNSVFSHFSFCNTEIKFTKQWQATFKCLWWTFHPADTGKHGFTFQRQKWLCPCKGQFTPYVQTWKTAEKKMLQIFFTFRK